MQQQHRFSSLNSKLVSALTAGTLALSLVAPVASAQSGTKESTKSASAAATAAKPDKKAKAEARAAFEKGQKAFKAGDFAEATASFQTANAILPTPHADWWIAMSLTAQPDKANEALAALEAFLSNSAKDKVGELKVKEAEAKLTELKAKQTGDVQLTTVPSGANVSVDGVAQAGVTPLALKLAPGRHKLDISAADYKSRVIEVEAVAGKATEAKVSLETLLPAPAPAAELPLPPPTVAAPVPAPVRPPDANPALPDSHARSNVPAYVTLGLAGAGVVVGSIFGAQALSAKSDFNAKPTSKSADEVERNALIADMAFGVAVTLGLTGVVLLTSSDDEEGGSTHATATRLDLTPYVHTKGGGATARFIF